jgi:tRNA (adenine22-N1)-methyltransferase
MNLSERLIHIIKLIPNCNCLADIGTDHGFIPIYSILNNITNFAIASDINVGPIKIAQMNICKYNLSEKIQTRVGSGLSTLEKNEADVIVIAGMGGILISEIIQSHIEIARNSKWLILQPVQNPEVLRKFLLETGFNIVDEDIVKDENKYYHIIKAENKKSQKYTNEAYYYTGTKLIEKRNPLIKEYINYKIESFNNILNNLSPIEQSSRYKELVSLKKDFEEILAYM